MALPPPAEDELAMAERHVVEGEERCARQAELIERLAAQGHDRAAGEAEQLLDTFKDVLALSRDHLHRLRRKHEGR